MKKICRESFHSYVAPCQKAGIRSSRARTFVAAVACLVLIGSLTPRSQAASPKETGPQPEITFKSPQVTATEGYATDGTNHYLFSTNWHKSETGKYQSKRGRFDLSNSITKYDRDWKQTDANMDPFAGLNPGLAHIGGAAYYHGRLYAPAEYWFSCENFGDQTIAVYDANAAGLPLVQHKDVSDRKQEISAIAIVPAKHELFTSSFCDGSKLMIYDLKTLAPKGSLSLSRNIGKIQGLSWSAKHHQFAMTSDDPQQKVGYVYIVSLDGQVKGPIYTTPSWGEMEGVDYTQGDTIRFLIGGHVYYLNPGSAAR